MYVLDSNTFRVLENYYPAVFPSFWKKFQQLVDDGEIRSVREVYRELENYAAAAHLIDWVDSNKGIFRPPTEDEMAFIGQILAVPHFQQLVGQKQRLAGSPVADPWIIACAHVHGGCVVTQESHKPHAAKIPNACEHYGVPCTNLEGLLGQLGWLF